MSRDRAHAGFSESNSGAQLTYYAVPLQKGETDTLRPQVLGLMLAAGFILLIACANLAGLTLVRMLRRRGEITTRLAWGHRPGRYRDSCGSKICCWPAWEGRLA